MHASPGSTSAYDADSMPAPSIPPSIAGSSAPRSAMAQVASDLSRSREKLAEAEKSNSELRRKIAEMSTKLVQAKAQALSMQNRKRDRSESPSGPASAEDGPSPGKKPKGQPREGRGAFAFLHQEAPFDEMSPPSPPRASYSASSNEKRPSEREALRARKEKFRQLVPNAIQRRALALDSIAVGYKILHEIEPGFDNLSLAHCASIAREEAAIVSKWTPMTCARHHDKVLAALKINFWSKKEAWFEQPFLADPSKTAKYWVKVLKCRAVAWEHKQKLKPKGRNSAKIA